MKTLVSTLLLLVLVPVASWALEIRVRGEAQLQVSANAAGTVAQVSGTLTDELRRSLSHRIVDIRIEDDNGRALLNRTATSDETGRFGIQEELPPGDYRVWVRFKANDHFDGIEFEDNIVLEPAPVKAELYTPILAVGRNKPVFVYGHATSAGIAFQGEGTVFVNGVNAGRLEFDAAGRGSVDVVDALAEGANRLQLVIPGSAYRAETTTENEIRFAEIMTIEAKMDERVERLSRGLSIHGFVSDATGPIAGIRVQGIFGTQPLAGVLAEPDRVTITTKTDKEGRFNTFIPWTRLGNGTWTGKARAIPNVGDSVELAVKPVEVDTTSSRAALSFLGNLVLVFGLLVLLWSVGRQARVYWGRLREERARRKRSREALETEETIVPVFLDQELSNRSSRLDVGGLVWDVWQSESIADATVTVKGNGGEHTVSADETGRFEFGELAPADYELSVVSRGFVTGVMKLKVPHDGRFRSFRVGMVAVPLKIRRIYQSLLEEASGEDPWGHLSPSEIEDQLWTLFHDPAVKWKSDDERRDLHERVVASLKDADVDGFDGTSLLSVMTDIVEESYFSGRRYDESVWMLARSLALQLRSQAGLEELA